MNIRWLTGISFVFLFCRIVAAAEAPALRIGVHEKPPYAIKATTGEWDGIGVELWKNIATLAHLRFEFVEMPYEKILPAVAEGRIDAAVGEIGVSAEWEQSVRFTQPYLISSGGVALHQKRWHIDWFQILGEFFNWTLAMVFLGIFAGMMLVSFVIWALERNRHVGHFRGGVSGFGSALWFAASTMTGVGYGDKTPSTFLGRTVSFVWMLVGVLLVASFTATVASSMAAARTGELVKVPGDLRRLSCGVMTGSISQKTLIREGIRFRGFETYEDAFAALSENRIDAVVGDKISLRFFVSQSLARTPPIRFSIPQMSLGEVFIGIPVRPGLPEYEAINLALLQTTSAHSWQAALSRWLGGRAD